MRRTNIYLDDDQATSLDQLARAQGVSRAALIRQVLDERIEGGESLDLESDLAAIEASFGVLEDEDVRLERGVDERTRYLDTLGRLE